MALAPSPSKVAVPCAIRSAPDATSDYDSEEITSGSKSSVLSPSLLRLFESTLFNMDLALQYMFRNEDPSVRSYLARRLYGFNPFEVDFYLPQLVSLYHHSSELAKHLHPYFINRCVHSTEFAIHLVWLLDTFDPPQQDSVRSAAFFRLSLVPNFSNSSSTALQSSLDPLTCANSDPGKSPLGGPEAATNTRDFSAQDLRATLLPYVSIPPADSSPSFFHESFSSSSASATQCSATAPWTVADSPRRSKSYPSGSIRTAITPRGDRNTASTHDGDSTSDTFRLADKPPSHTTTLSSCRRSHSLQLRPTFETSFMGSSLAATNSNATVPVLDRSTLGRIGPRNAILVVQRRMFSAPSVNFVPHTTVPSITSNYSPLRLYLDLPSNVKSDATNTTANPTTTYEESPGKSGVVFPSDNGPRPVSEALRSSLAEAVSSHSTNGYSDLPSPCHLIRLQKQLSARLMPEWDFVDSLLRLARRLMPITSKEQRTAYLQAELANLNLYLPARVWIPVNKADHIILRIPPTSAVCLNSKSKAPYLIYLEVLSCGDPWTDPLPSRPTSITSSRLVTSPDSTVATSLTSLSGCPWNSNTPSSASGSGILPAPDTMSLLSDDSVNLLAEPDACADIPPVPECARPCSNGAVILSEVSTTDLHISVPPNAPVYVGASQIRNRLKEQSERHPQRSFVSDPEDPSAAVLKEPWRVKCQRIRALSPWGSLPGWRLNAAIVKVGDDLRQEQLAYQLLSVLQRIWQAEYIPLWLRPLNVIVTSPDSGLIEPVPDTVSFHQIRRHARLSLLEYLLREHGPPNSEAFLTVQRNFVHSCAAYSIVGYLLQVKDRHNGNILLDNEGHVIHIDYGFMLSASPGKNIGFEASPFKLTAEQVAVMGGVGSDMFEYFKCLLLRGLLAARKYMDQVCALVEIARMTCPQLPCFVRGGGSAAISGLRQRFQLSRTEEQLRQSTERMVEDSLHSITTKLYDSFQYYTNGIQ